MVVRGQWVRNRWNTEDFKAEKILCMMEAWHYTFSKLINVQTPKVSPEVNWTLVDNEVSM